MVDPRLEDRRRLRAQGQREWDECEHCPYVGFGEPSTYHRWDNPTHRMVHVRDLGRREEPEAAHTHAVRFNSQLTCVRPTLADALIDAQVLMKSKGGLWRRFNVGMWRQDDWLVTVFPHVEDVQQRGGLLV